MRRILLIAFFICIFPLSCWSWDSMGEQTHHSLIYDALHTISNQEFPDLYLFEAQIRTGSNSEEPHNGLEFNGGRPAVLWNNTYSSYETLDMLKAYLKIGHICHLTQDQAVPAHAANISHGPKSTPPHFDDLEFYVDSNFICSIHECPSNMYVFDYYQTVQDSVRNATKVWTKPSSNNTQYWKAAPDAPPTGQDATFGPNGQYGGYDGNMLHCLEWDIYGSFSTESPELAEICTNLAASYTVGVLTQASKSLPPLIKSIDITPTAQVTPCINVKTGNTITFRIIENRKPDVKVFIAVDSRDGEPISQNYGEGVQLTLDPDSELPWGKTFSINWNGRLANGQYPADGLHKLHIRVEDADGNESPEAFHYFIIDNTPPKIAVSPNGGKFRGPITVNVAVGDEHLDVQSVTMSVNGQTNCFTKTAGRDSVAGYAVLPPGGKYAIKVTAKDQAGNESVYGADLESLPPGTEPPSPGGEPAPGVFGVDDIDNPDPTYIQFSGGQALPKSETPFQFSSNAGAQVGNSLNLPYTVSQASLVNIGIYDSSGNLVKNLASNQLLSPGSHAAMWDGLDNAGGTLPDGTYTYIINGVNAQNACEAWSGSGEIIMDSLPPLAEIDLIKADTPMLGYYTIMGTASDEHFGSCLLELIGGDMHLQIEAGKSAVEENLLGSFDASNLEEGIYLLRLTARDIAGNASISEMPLVIKHPHGLKVQMESISQRLDAGLDGYNTAADDPGAWLEDELPTGSTAIGAWEWNSNSAYSGSRCHTDPESSGAHGHYFIHSDKTLDLTASDNIIQYVYLDPENPPSEILLQFYSGNGNGEHRAYWGGNHIPTGGYPGSACLYYMGNLPPAGKWIRLKIPAEVVGLCFAQVKGMAFYSFNGKAYWDKTTKSSNLNYSEIQKGSWAVASQVTEDWTHTLSYATSQDADIRLEIRDGSDNLLRTLVNGFQPRGAHEAVWDGRDEAGRLLPDGKYYFQFGSPDPGTLDSNTYAVVRVPDQSLSLTPQTAVTDSLGNQYVIDIENRLVKRIDSAGNTCCWIGKDTLGLKELTPTSLAVDQHDNLFILDKALGKVFECNSSGYYVNELPLPQVSWAEKDFKLIQPDSVALTPNGDVLIANQDGSDTLSLGIGRGTIEVSNLQAEIRVPYEKSLVYAFIPVIGTAAGAYFDRYTVEYGVGENPASWIKIAESKTQAFDTGASLPVAETLYGNLATWQVTQDPYQREGGLPMGTYTIRLRVFDRFGGFKEDFVNLEVGRIISYAGTLKSDDGLAELSIPNGALTDDVDLFSVKPVDPAVAPPISNPDLIQVGKTYEILPAGYRFLSPCTLKLSYTQEQFGSLNENTLKIYRWNPICRSWIYVPGELDSENNTLTTKIAQFPNGKVYYAVLSDPPPAPILFEPLSPSSLRLISISGKASPGVSVEIFVDGISQGRAQAHEDTGYFVKTGVQLHAGDNRITAKATDPQGNAGPPSATVTVLFDPVQPLVVEGLAFKTSDWADILTAASGIGDTLYIELAGTDPDPLAVNTAEIVLKSSADPVGIYLQLIETGPNSGIYRGTIKVGESSNSPEGTIGVSPLSCGTVEISCGDGIKMTLGTVDKNPPPAPVINSSTHPSVCQDTFETGLGEWSNMSGVCGATVIRSTEQAFSGDYAVKLLNEAGGGSFANYIRTTPYDAKKFPVIGFDYKMPQGVKVNLVAYVNGMWKELTFTDDPKTVETFEEDIYRNIGGIKNVMADGTWHHALFNLYNMLRNDDPGRKEYLVESLFFADYNLPGWMELVMGEENPKGSAWFIDNFIITAGGKADNSPAFTWSTSDPGVIGYSYILDQEADSLPDEISEGSEASVSYSGLADGIWYFHVRCIDAAGNWGPANHYQIVIDTKGPVAGSPIPEDQSFSGNLAVKVKLSDTGSGVNPDSIQLKLNEKIYDVKSGGLNYDENNGVLTFTLCDVLPKETPWNDGQVIEAALISASDYAGNPLSNSLSWSWTVSYAKLAGGYLSLLTTKGGMTPSYCLDGTKVAFTSERSGNPDIWIIDADDYAELRGSARQITTDSSDDHHPSWSPVDDRIAFVSNRDGHEHIWLVNADGSGLKQLTTGTCDDSHPSWSPNGSEIAFSRDGEIWIIHADGTNEFQVTFDSVEPNLEPAWSPDGKKIAVTKSLYQDHVALLDLATGGMETITESGSDSMPAWAQSTWQLLFVSQRDAKKDEIWVTDNGGLWESKFIDNQGWWDSEPQVSPVSDDVAFESTRNGLWNLWVKTRLEVDYIYVEPKTFSPDYDGNLDSTDIHFITRGAAAEVNLEVYNSSGELVATLIENKLIPPGETVQSWNGTDSSGKRVPDGAYSCKVRVTGAAGAQTLEQSGTVIVDTAGPAFNNWHLPELNLESLFNLQGTVSVNIIDASRLDEIRLQYGISTTDSQVRPDLISWADFSYSSKGTLALAWDNYIGEYLYLRGYGEDAVGNASYSEIKKSRIGNYAPTCQLISPVGGEIWSGVQSIDWKAADADGDPVNISIELSSDGGISWRTLSLLQENNGSYLLDTKNLPDGSNYLVKVTATDGRAETTSRSNKAFTILNNKPPVAEAGPDQNTFAGQAVTLDGGESYDPEGNLISFLWSFISVPPASAVADASLSDRNSAKPLFIPDADGTYVVKLTVTDGVFSAHDQVSVFVTTPNSAPNADAGQNQNAGTGETVHLDGSRSFDPDNGPEALSFVWSFVSLPSASKLTNSSIEGVSEANAAFIPDADGIYSIRLVVHDGKLSSEAMVEVNAHTAIAPNARAGEDFTACLNGEALLDGSQSNDPDNAPASLTYYWRFVSLPEGSALSSPGIVGADGKYAFFVPDVPGTYVVELRVDDGKSFSFDNVTVTASAKKELVVSAIPGQRYPFVSFDLDNYVTGIDPAQVQWSYSGNKKLGVSISTDNLVKIDRLSQDWNEPETVTFTARAMSCDGEITAGRNVTFYPNHAPDCTKARPSQEIIWSPDHRLVDIYILGVTDPDGDPVRIAITKITSDEPTASDRFSGGAKYAPDGYGLTSSYAKLRAERSETGNGRVYTIHFRASDNRGGESEGRIIVQVPHDSSKQSPPAVDSGQRYDATAIN